MNKYIILQNMSEEDLDKLLPFLTQDQLALGLNFFTEEKLMKMSKELPIEVLLVMVLEKFQMIDILALMEDSAMDKFIMQPEVERKYAQKYLEGLGYQQLQEIMVKSFGYEFKDKSKKEYVEHLEKLEDADYKRFLISFDREQKVELLNGIIDQEPNLALLLKADDVARPMNMLMKEDKIKLMSSLDHEFLVPMIQELPIDLTQIVLTQIDPKDFADILVEDFQNILSEVVLFSGAKS